MGTIDLGPPRPTPHDLLDGLPRRVALTLPELRFVAERADGAPLPFELRDAGPDEGGGLDDRLGRGRCSEEQQAYAAALGNLHDPATSPSRRGLLVGGPDDGVVEDGIVGAVGLLATPDVAVDLDVAAGTVQVRSWHRQSGGAWQPSDDSSAAAPRGRPVRAQTNRAAQRMSCTNSPSWVRLRHSTIGTTSP